MSKRRLRQEWDPKEGVLETERHRGRPKLARFGKAGTRASDQPMRQFRPGGSRPGCFAR